MKSLMITTLLILAFVVCQVNAEPYIVIEAEDFDAKKGDTFQIITVPATVKCQETSEPRAPNLPVGTTEFGIGRASGGAFIGNPDFSGVSGDWVKYEFNVPTEGDWYVWALVVAPTIGDNSYFIGIDIPDERVVGEDNDDMNIWDFHEAAEVPDDGLGTPLNERLTTDWVWFPLCSRTGNPFPGTEVQQFGPDPVPLNLTAGTHTFHLAHREHSFCDVIFGTMDATEHPSQAGVAVHPIGKMTTTWSQIKQTR
jgi:hypothetical protein